MQEQYAHILQLQKISLANSLSVVMYAPTMLDNSNLVNFEYIEILKVNFYNLIPLSHLNIMISYPSLLLLTFTTKATFTYYMYQSQINIENLHKHALHSQQVYSIYMYVNINPIKFY